MYSLHFNTVLSVRSICICVYIWKWAQSQQLVHILVKFTHRIDAPVAFGVKEEEVSINPSWFGFNASNENKRFTLQVPLWGEIIPEESKAQFGDAHGRCTFILKKNSSSNGTSHWKQLISAGSKKAKNMHIWWDKQEQIEVEEGGSGKKGDSDDDDKEEEEEMEKARQEKKQMKQKKQKKKRTKKQKKQKKKTAQQQPDDETDDGWKLFVQTLPKWAQSLLATAGTSYGIASATAAATAAFFFFVSAGPNENEQQQEKAPEKERATEVGELLKTRGQQPATTKYE